LEQCLLLEPQRVLCSHGNSGSPDMIKKNRAYLREIEKRCRDLLNMERASDIKLEQVSEIIHYSFDEAIEPVMEDGEVVDRTYYPQMHEHNVRCIWQWVTGEVSAQA
jgi:hypothetical protein